MKPGVLLQARDLLWPEFVDEGDAVFLRRERENIVQDIASFGTLADQECFINHVHILDWCESNASLATPPFWDVTSPDFRDAVELAALMAETWATKLAL